jgi:hypothetical protein
MGEVFEKIDHTSTYRLRASYTREIGRVIVRWAFFEHHIQTVIWGLAFNFDKMSGSLGRLAIAEQKSAQRLKLIRQLAKVRRVGLDDAILESIEGRSEKLVEERNLLTHGCWTQHPRHGWLVKETRGNWSGEGEGAPRGPRKLMPEEMPRDATKISRTPERRAALVERLVDAIGSSSRSASLQNRSKFRRLISRR